MRNKIFAVINIIWGVIGIFYQLLLLLAVYPKIMDLYKSMEGETSSVMRYYPMVSIGFVVFLAYVVYTAVKLLRSKTPSIFLYKQNIVFTIIVILGGFIFTAFSVTSLITPLYNLTNSL